MANIKIMDEDLSNKIAAGEVVEKCVSIVKELVENSIDALSNEIKIFLKESGIKEIKVVDNGIGMDKDDALLAFQRHATSKLTSISELFSINTLGFRGEAIPSIASVSEIILKTGKDNMGTMIRIKGGKILEKKSCEAIKGTSFLVTNLFYNTPARLKYLSSLWTELANIIEYVNKMALAHPNIKFVLYNDDKELLNTDGSSNLLKVIKDIYGIDIAKKMIEIQNCNNDYNIYGYISLPEVTKSNRNHITTLVNGRVVKNMELNRYINDSYHNFKEDSRYPIVVLNIEVDPSLIDVNIHPSKLDIKFSFFDDLKDLITKTIIDKIKNKLLIPKIEIHEKISSKFDNLTLNLERNIIKESDYEYTTSLEQLVRVEEKPNNIYDVKEEVLINNYIEEITNDKKLPELYVVGLLLGTYIVCQNELGLYLMDFHAAKERINYEKYLYILSYPNNNTIDMLVPIIIELPLNEYLIVKENMDIIDNLNITMEEFGHNSFRIKSHPTWFKEGMEEEIIRKIIELVLTKEKKFDLAIFNDRLAMSIACKKSVKANTDITIDEMERLINDLRQCNNPYNCPHGRPTIINWTKYELEKLFKRSV